MKTNDWNGENALKFDDKLEGLESFINQMRKSLNDNLTEINLEFMNEE
jgi:hypothetical protein